MKALLKNFAIFDIPLLIFMGQIVVEIFVPNAEKPAFHSEGGPHEIVQVVFLSLALPTAIWLCFRVKNKWLKLWTGIAGLCCFYVLGEEISWGQHIFGWVTPEEWARLNDQNETNAHNTSTWLDQKPRALLEIGVLVGGLIIPALKKWMPEKLPERFKDIYPGYEVVFTAAFAVTVKILAQFQFEDGTKIFWRSSEMIELYLYYFVMLYLIGLGIRWKREGKL